MKKLTVLAVALVVAAFATSASAEEQGKLTVPVTIYGRPNKPNVTVEVARATMKLPLKDLTGPSSSAVGVAAKKAPF